VIDPSLPLQKGIVARLRDDAPLMAIVDRDGVFDAPPQTARRPYVVVGFPQVLPDKVDGIDGTRTRWTLHGWADGPGKGGIYALGAALLAALDEQTVDADGHHILTSEFEQLQYLDDPDPNIKHVVLVLIFLTEPA
jgi:hypothetical protein